MNMPIANIKRSHIQAHTLAAKQVAPKLNLQDFMAANDHYSQVEINNMLDKHFPLQAGSHNDVKQYVVYFCHLMVFFKDGTHCGLVKGTKLAGYLGSRDFPESILLLANNEYVEIVLDTYANDSASNAEQALKKIEFPTQKTFTSPSGADFSV